MEGYFEIGKVAGAHGVKGALRVFPTTEDPSRFRLLKEALILFQGEKKAYPIQQVSFHKQFVLLSLEGIGDRDMAERLKGATLLVPEAEAIPLEENEYYNRDLYGMRVYTDTGEDLGILTEIYPTGANDVYEVKKNPQDKQFLLLPAIRQCILQVDVKERIMVVHLLKGLRE